MALDIQCHSQAQNNNEKKTEAAAAGMRTKVPLTLTKTSISAASPPPQVTRAGVQMLQSFFLTRLSHTLWHFQGMEKDNNRGLTSSPAAAVGGGRKGGRRGDAH